MATVQVIDRFLPIKQKKIRVAAYARVSNASEMPLHSLGTQIDYFTTLIQSDDSYEFAGVYVDEGITGTSIKKRSGFTQLIADCKTRKIDMVLVKSISRFARNTVDCLKVTRELKELGIPVVFERENINSMSADGELMLTLLASFAQEESRSISENIKWAIRNKFKEGKQNGVREPYGYKWNGEKYVIVPEEGKVIETIFDKYLQGESAYRICKDLKDKGFSFSESTIKYILSNPAYSGDKVLQKTYQTMSRKKKINRGELSRFVVSEMFEPIIDNETFEKVQVVRKKNAEKSNNFSFIPTAFSGIVKCGHCGCGVSRRTARGEKVWKCNTKERKGTCDLHHITEKELMDISCDVLKMDMFDEENFKSRVKKITLYNNRLEFSLKNDTIRKINRKFGGFKKKSGFSGKLKCSKCEGTLTADKYKNKKVWLCNKTRKSSHLYRLEDVELRKATKYIFDDAKDYEGLFATYIDKAIIYDDKIEFIFKEGEVKTWQRE